MASRADEQNYNDMIQALAAFATTVDAKTDELQSLAGVCQAALQSEDSAVIGINSKIRDAQKKYLACAKKALEIAKAMQQELVDHKEEEKVWAED